MQTPETNIWMNERDARYSTGIACVPYLTKQQNQRLARITLARRLYEGDHYDVFVSEQRTRWPVPKIKLQNEKVEVYSPINLLKLISNKSAGLLYGAEPQFKTGGGEQERKLKALIERSHLQSLLIESEIECSFAGESILHACIFEGEVIITAIPAEHIFPEGDLLPTRQYASYVYYAEANRGTEDAPDWRLLEVRYRAGSIERAVYRLSPDKEKGAKVDLKEWPAFAAEAPAEVESTGIALNTIIWIPNLIMKGRALSDYDGLIGPQDKLNFKQSQLDAVLAKHGSPKMAIPRVFADKSGGVAMSNQEGFFIDNKDQIPQYITWSAEIGSASAERDAAVDHECVIAEMSPMLLGIARGGIPESAAKYKLNATSSVDKANRKAILRRPLVKRALTVAQMLEQTIAGVRYDVGEISVEFRDGLPVDELAEAQIVSLHRSAKTMSQRAAVERRVNNPVAAQAELNELDAENRASIDTTIGMLTQEPGEPNDQQHAPSDASTEAA